MEVELATKAQYGVQFSGFIDLGYTKLLYKTSLMLFDFSIFIECLIALRDEGEMTCIADACSEADLDRAAGPASFLTELM